MLTQFGYLSAWSIYLVAAVVFYFMLWPLFKRLGPRPVQLFFRALVAVVVFTPAISVPEQGLWAPAYIVALVSLMQHDEVRALHAGMFIAGSLCIIGLLFALEYILGKLGKGGGQQQASKSKAKPKPVAKKAVKERIEPHC
ncbi:hypothetical protein BTA51_10920 [Hahella sp. CCB-MM4]|uniref:hypothetical protein n=1 Tax=Hahella sp. (strain CCB-MM4) TaxID=1926491 RepID=UPI000B9B5D00|nr:hypothetical protein [Hahella sp. CCB-MM4]OZG73520.1 hypothetical protein BTA51_10920 [Hahella sp. CCB-MM4]